MKIPYIKIFTADTALFLNDLTNEQKGKIFSAIIGFGAKQKWPVIENESELFYENLSAIKEQVENETESYLKKSKINKCNAKKLWITQNHDEANAQREVAPAEQRSHSDPFKAVSSKQEAVSSKQEVVKTIPNPNPSPQGEGIEEFKRVIQSCQITDEARAAQAQIAKRLEDNGYNCVLEFPIADRGDGRRGRIDILAEKNGLKFAIEFDNAACRNKSVFKLLRTGFLKIILLRSGEARPVEGIDWVFSFGLNDSGEPEDLNAGTFRKPCKTKIAEAAKTWAEYKAPELVAKGTAAQTKIFITRHAKILKDLLVMVDDDIELLSWLFAAARDRFKDLEGWGLEAVYRNFESLITRARINRHKELEEEERARRVKLNPNNPIFAGIEPKTFADAAPPPKPQISPTEEL
jgi:hypothetical protein